MEYALRFAHQGIWYLSVPIVLFVVIWRMLRYKPVQYVYPLTTMIVKAGFSSTHWYKKILTILRVSILALLTVLLLKPQLVDTSSQIKVAGIDIMLVLDISGSMQFQDFHDDQRARVDIAKDEAIRFIAKRDNDAIGLVVFGRDAISRCPLTLDKHMLTACVQDLQIGTVNPEGTVLAKSLLAAVNRLKDSRAKSKIIIALTDGEPSDEDSDPKIPIEIAKKLGIKIYTIGIGGESDEQFVTTPYGIALKPQVNAPLLSSIAEQTGGAIFYGPKLARYARYLYYNRCA